MNSNLKSDQPVLTRKDRLKIFSFEECELILENLLADRNVRGSLKEFKIIPASEHTGFLGEYYHLNLDFVVENESTLQSTRLFVKSVIYQNADMSYYMEKLGVLKKEAMLYKTLLNELKKFSPSLWCAKCYFIRDDVFVMQNIEELGYTPMSEQRFLTESELLPMLKGLATMHASSIAYEHRHQVTIGIELRQWLNEISVDPDVEWWTTGLQCVLAVIAQHPKASSDAQAQAYIAKELPRLLDNVYYMVNPSAVHRNVFCHRDSWGGNVFYHKIEPHTKSCVFVDFQLCRYAPPAIDFLFATYVNVQPTQRRAMEQRCIAHYYECLGAELRHMGIDVEVELSRAAFEKSLKDFALFGATYNCIAATILRLPNNYLKTLKESDPTHFHRFCNVSRTADVLNLIGKYSDFRDYMYDCVGDLLELTYNGLTKAD